MQERWSKTRNHKIEKNRKRENSLTKFAKKT